MTVPVKVLVVDDHPVARRGVASLLAEAFPVLEIRETGTTAAIGANGGTTGTIEFVGVTSTTGGMPNPTRSVAGWRPPPAASPGAAGAWNRDLTCRYRLDGPRGNRDAV